MKPLIVSAAVLKEFAGGSSYNLIDESVSLYLYEGRDFDAIVNRSDGVNDQRAVILRDGFNADRVVPDLVKDRKKHVISRMASFVERAKVPGPISLPVGWGQYKQKNFISFFAVPSSDPNSTRWIVDLVDGSGNNVVFCELTSSKSKEVLESYEPKQILNKSWIEGRWRTAVDASSGKFEEPQVEQNPDVEMNLQRVSMGPSQGWSYLDWLSRVSADQSRFINAPTGNSIRLRGPAGSGKTMALMLKALREVYAARDANSAIRVLFVTHSWSLASEVSDSLELIASGMVKEIDVFPLLDIAQSISPHYVNDDTGFQLIGNDSLSGKQAQLDEIAEILDHFINGDWITFRAKASSDLARRMDSCDRDDRLALIWDLLTEFGSVIGPAAIFPGAGAENKYLQLSRATWMMPLHNPGDRSIVFEIYSRYVRSLEERSLLTSDQVLSDLLSHLETHAWNRARKNSGYDLIFVDEFHLFNHLERQVIHYLSRNADLYPRVFMAVDPRQSPSEEYIGAAADSTQSGSSLNESNMGNISNFELTSVHRFTPEILKLVKHLHHCFPALDLGQDWDIDFSAVESTKESGPVPTAYLAASDIGEKNDIVRSVHSLYQKGRIALAFADGRKARRYSELVSDISKSGKFHVTYISGKSDLEGLGYRKRGLVVGPAEYLAGLQFDFVFIAGLSDISSEVYANERTRLLSLLYLGISRAEREVRIFANDADGGLPDVLQQAYDSGFLQIHRGEAV